MSQAPSLSRVIPMKQGSRDHILQMWHLRCGEVLQHHVVNGGLKQASNPSWATHCDSTLTTSRAGSSERNSLILPVFFRWGKRGPERKGPAVCDSGSGHRHVSVFCHMASAPSCKERWRDGETTRGVMRVWGTGEEQMMETTREAFSSHRPPSVAILPSARTISRPAMGLSCPLPPQPGSVGNAYATAAPRLL